MSEHSTKKPITRTISPCCVRYAQGLWWEKQGRWETCASYVPCSISLFSLQQQPNVKYCSSNDRYSWINMNQPNSLWECQVCLFVFSKFIFFFVKVTLTISLLFHWFEFTTLEIIFWQLFMQKVSKTIRCGAMSYVPKNPSQIDQPCCPVWRVLHITGAKMSSGLGWSWEMMQELDI